MPPSRSSLPGARGHPSAAELPQPPAPGRCPPGADTRARAQGAGLLVLAGTSNPGAADLQEELLLDGRPLWERTAELIAEWGAGLIGESGLSSVGAVVGATHPEAVERARELMPAQVLLLPGVGAQGGSAADLAAAFRDHPAGRLGVAARSVIYARREPRG